MTQVQLQQLQKQLWNIANTLRGTMGADEFRDYILGFIFFKYLSEKSVNFANELLDGEDLIQKFIEENMPKMINGQSVQTAFSEFWDAEKEQAYQHLCKEENLKPEAMKQVLEHYEFTKRLPRKEELKDLPNYKVKLFERENVFSNLLVKTRQLIEKFYVGF
ncbi:MULTISPECIES: type I restriction endonuclease subunit R, EcoR124 family [Acinetobacter]|uniref:Type I restriction enzyme R protein C-terminal domain-containing protein n=1 Tax=Acinetobacter schindleri TaxID=108981 RepID=A0AAE6WRK4_9GAMM|nr:MULTISPECIES: type I restriction-modification system subunit M N-terminal domain-containing protein [Acinetobacter]QIC66003.1 hypothetical protein FSC10_00785 [Acinetobacter schindleri]